MKEMSNLLAMSLAGSAIVVLMLLLRPVTAKIFPAKWQYRIGKMSIAFFLIPVYFFIEKLPLAQPAIQNYHSEPFIIRRVASANGLADTADAVDVVIKKHLSVEAMQVILLIWLVGAIVFATWHFYCYRRFTRQLRAGNASAPENAAALLSSCKAALDIHGEVKLMQNCKITSPMLVGLFRPMILLPASNMQEIDLKLILTHELMHLKRKDLWVKMLALAAGTLNWFNPFAYVLCRDISIWGELSCDEVLTSGMSHEERKLYGEAILNTLEIHSGLNTAFCSSLCESKRHIERRLTMLLNVRKTKTHISILAIAAIVAIASIGTAVSTLASQNIPEAEDEQVTTEYMDQGSTNHVAERSILPYSALSEYEKEAVTKEIAKYYVDEEGRVIPYDGKAKEVPFDALSAEEQRRVTVEDGYYPDDLLTPQEVSQRMLSDQSAFRITKRKAEVPAEPVTGDALPEYWAMGALSVDGVPYLPLVKTAEVLGYTVDVSSFKIADEVPDWDPQYPNAVEYNYELSKDGKSLGIASLDISDGIVISYMVDQIFCNTHDKSIRNSFVLQGDTVYMPAQFFKEALDTDNKLP